MKEGRCKNEEAKNGIKLTICELKIVTLQKI